MSHDSEIRRACQSKTDDELLRALLCDSDDYAEEALPIIREQIEQRIGSLDGLIERERGATGAVMQRLDVASMQQNPPPRWVQRGSKTAKGQLLLCAHGLGFFPTHRQQDPFVPVIRRLAPLVGYLDRTLQKVEDTWAGMNASDKHGLVPVSLLARLLPAVVWVAADTMVSVEQQDARVTVFCGGQWRCRFELDAKRRAQDGDTLAAWCCAREVATTRRVLRRRSWKALLGRGR